MRCTVVFMRETPSGKKGKKMQKVENIDIKEYEMILNVMETDVVKGILMMENFEAYACKKYSFEDIYEFEEVAGLLLPDPLAPLC